jgi:hypothetical protein
VISVFIGNPKRLQSGGKDVLKLILTPLCVRILLRKTACLSETELCTWVITMAIRPKDVKGGAMKDLSENEDEQSRERAEREAQYIFQVYLGTDLSTLRKIDGMYKESESTE